MTDQALLNILEWCKHERERLKVQLDALKQGKFRVQSNDGSGWKDTTQDNIQKVEANVAELSKLILDYEATKLD